MKAVVDFKKNIGEIKALNGVSNGPICHETDLSCYFKELNISTVRYHDTDGCGAHGRYMIDVSRIFPNFDADEYDERNYMFHHTDLLITAAVKCGAEIIYRFGESIDHTIYKRHARPPKDFEKFARICVQIIKHYNMGWANGFRFNIRYWEIWNEPEGVKGDGTQPNWSGGTFEQMLELYKIMATQIKTLDSELLVGGLSFMYKNKEMQQYIKFCCEERLPIDFLSYHHYASDFNWIEESALVIRDWLRESGFNSTELIVAEWNCVCYDRYYEGNAWNFFDDPINGCKDVKQIYENMKSEMGASFVAGFLIKMNDLPIDKAIYYDFDPSGNWCGLFDRYLIPTKTFYAFKSYGELLKKSTCRVAASLDDEYAQILAGKTENGGGILLSNHYGKDENLEITVKGQVGSEKITVYRIDDVSCMDVQTVENNGREEITFCVPLKENTTLYIIME